MEGIVFLIIVVLLVIFIGAILGIVAFTRGNVLLTQLTQLNAKVQELESKLTTAQPPISSESETLPSNIESSVLSESQPATEVEEFTVTNAQSVPVQSNTIEEISDSKTEVKPTLTDDINTPDPKDAPQNETPNEPPIPQPSALSLFAKHLIQHWMVWLGGACVGLAGIFLAKYSIESGLLGPTARISMGMATGISLHAAAFWVRNRFGNHPSLAALAGGGSITLFATLLAALHLYALFNPMVVFILLALVALATMFLALQHGPILAAIGMLGAYCVPILVSSEHGNIILAMIYALIISASVLLLLRHIQAAWLWWGLIAGGLGWWALSLASSDADGLRGLYLAVLAYGLMAFPDSNWKLNQLGSGNVWPFNQPNNPIKHSSHWLAVSLLLLAMAKIATVLLGNWPNQWLNWSVLAALLLWLSGTQPKYCALPWVIFIGTLVAMLGKTVESVGSQFKIIPINPELTSALFLFLMIFTGVFLLLALRNFLLGSSRNWSAALLTVTPVASLLCAYLMADHATSHTTSTLVWCLLNLILGGSYIFLATLSMRKQWPQPLTVWSFLAGHLAYSIAAAITLNQASFTLALATQLISISWLMKRFNVGELSWLFKAVVTVVVVRLTLNPWLADYPAMAHWPLWTYGGATLICFVASRQLKDWDSLKQWGEVAALHLFALTVWAELRYLMYSGEVFSTEFTFTEAALNVLLFGSLTLVYYLKANVSQTLAKWYRGYSFIQLGIASVNYGILLGAILIGDSWLTNAVGETPLFNILLLAYGVPVVIAYLVYKFYAPAIQKTALAVFSAGSFIFITLQIRHLWQATIDINLPTSAGELYTYSIVWLGLAVTAMLLGSWRYGKRCYQTGLGLLAVVIIKIFMIDMAHLDGLLRVASFMGLGIALLGIAFLHRSLSSKLVDDEPKTE